VANSASHHNVFRQACKQSISAETVSNIPQPAITDVDFAVSRMRDTRSASGYDERQSKIRDWGKRVVQQRWMRLALMRAIVVVVFAAGAVGAVVRAETGLAEVARTETDTVDFQRHIQPILSMHCLKCHGMDDPAGGLCLVTRDSAISSGAIDTEQGEHSALLERVTSQDDSLRMPPDGEPLNEVQIELLRRWIVQGANWPEHWAYRALEKPRVPWVEENAQRDWCRTPIDRFVLQQLAQHDLEPSPAADRLTLIRRASYTLLGMPPTPAEVDAFVNDPAPDAWLRCIDRLLASPHYGERWARHWMDLVHFAETHGHDQDRPREHAWPYRDYLVRSFNQDKPYAQFVAEQIAGDVLDPFCAEAIVATGFLAAGPWDESSLRDIREDSIDREIGRYLDRDDIVTTVMSTFASTSVHCARCHDHKFDPITQAEYFGLQAVFAGIDKANRTFDADSTSARRRVELADEQRRLERAIAEDPDILLTPDVEADLMAWENAQQRSSVAWQLPEIVNVRSHAGADLKSDASKAISASGPRPDKDIYTVDLATTLPQVTAIRLELLTDQRLPQAGPGRAENGNLHLNEVRVFQHDAAQPETLMERTIAAPFADFNQDGWSVAASVDGDSNSAWGIFPEVGKPHVAVFPLQQAINNEGSAGSSLTLRIELHQIHGGGHLIGRFRLSVTDANPASLRPNDKLDYATTMILDTPRPQRTVEQQRELAIGFLRNRLKRAIDALPPPQIVFAGTNRFEPDGSFRPASTPRPIHVLERGQIDQPSAVAEARALACVAGLSHQLAIHDPSDEGSRRVALARWLTDDRNALVWRSIVNRVWQHHFGQGLVETPNDFGRMGAAPSHPELLNWLAATFQEQGGSFKALHRLILSSAVYRQTSADNIHARQVDAGNRLLWRMNRRRVDAESFRDGLLRVSESLDTTVGGPSVRQFIQSPGVHVTPVVNYQDFDVDDPANRRRSVYRFLFRTIPDPFMEALDCPDASQLTPTRTESLTALQALATLHDKFVVRQSELFSQMLEHQTTDHREQLRIAYRRLFGRVPTEFESQAVMNYARKHGLPNACRFLFNTNEFLFVD
jgi:hypothetical protein